MKFMFHFIKYGKTRVTVSPVVTPFLFFLNIIIYNKSTRIIGKSVPVTNSLWTKSPKSNYYDLASLPTKHGTFQKKKIILISHLKKDEKSLSRKHKLCKRTSHLHLLWSAPVAVSRACGHRKLSPLELFFLLCSVFTLFLQVVEMLGALYRS